MCRTEDNTLCKIAPVTLTDLARVATRARVSTRRRDELIAQAKAEGYTWPQIAEASGMSEQGAMRAARRAGYQPGKPAPGVS